MNRGLVLAVVALGLPGCSGSVDFSFGGQTPVEAAIELIEGEAMAQRLGIDQMTDTRCVDPADESVGTTFLCTAVSGGATVEFEVLLEADDKIFAGPTNVVDGPLLAGYASSAVAALNADHGFGLPEDAIDCGERSVILDPDRQMICVLTDPGTGQTFDAALRVTDTERGTFDVEVLGESG